MRHVLIFLGIYLTCACEQKTERTSSVPVDTVIQENVQPILIRESIEETFPDENPQVIKLGQAGKIRKGMPALLLYQLFDSVQIRKSVIKSNANGNSYKYSIYQTSETPAIICLTSSTDSIFNITLQSTDYKTAKNIGVGNSFVELSKAYHVARIYADKTSRVFAKVEELQQEQEDQKVEDSVQFELGFDATGLTTSKGDIPVSAIPPDVKIISILL